MAKRAPKPEPDLRKAEKREAAIRVALAADGGVTGPTMRAISRFFGHYSARPHPELFLDVLGHVGRLQIMALPEHRNGVGGAIAAVVSLHPEYQDAWRAAQPRLIESAERLSPPIIDEEISRPGQTEYLWMLWIVTRDRNALQRIIRLAHRHDSVGEAALSLLHAHATMPEVQASLIQTLAARQARMIPHFAVATTDVPIEDIRSLRDAVTAHVPNLKKVVLVGWLAGMPEAPKPKRRGKAKPQPESGADVVRTGGFLIVTVDGGSPPGCPISWNGKPVIVRKAKPEEMRAHRAMRDAAEEP